MKSNRRYGQFNLKRKIKTLDVDDLPYYQNIWSVTQDGYPLETQLENPAKGTYHGYPMPLSDPMAAEVMNQWKRRSRMIKQWEEQND